MEVIKMISIFVPSHITGFFSIYQKNNKLLRGSMGCGVLLDKGVKTILSESDEEGFHILINGKEDEYYETISKNTIEIINQNYPLSDYLLKNNLTGITINHEIEVPIGCGFGTSGSSCLGIALGLKEILNLPIDYTRAGQFAHLSEVSLNCGLGDVIAQMSKGIVLRTKPGSPGIGETKSIKSDYYIVSKALGKISTASIITDPQYIKKTTSYGIEVQKKFVENPTSENFIKCSYEFSQNIGLLNNYIEDMINEFNEFCIGSSMAMIGNTVFGLSNDISSLSKEYMINKIDNNGIKIFK